MRRISAKRSISFGAVPAALFAAGLALALPGWDARAQAPAADAPAAEAPAATAPATPAPANDSAPAPANQNQASPDQATPSPATQEQAAPAAAAPPAGSSTAQSSGAPTQPQPQQDTSQGAAPASQGAIAGGGAGEQASGAPPAAPTTGTAVAPNQAGNVGGGGVPGAQQSNTNTGGQAPASQSSPAGGTADVPTTQAPAAAGAAGGQSSVDQAAPTGTADRPQPAQGNDRTNVPAPSTTSTPQPNAAPMLGAPTPWGIDLQPAGGPVKEAIHDFNILTLWIIVVITIFVAGLIGWVCWRYRASANPTPSRTSHHTVLEIAWTVVPVLILLVIAIPSFRLIYYEDRAREPDMTIGVQGRQWYWHYSYPDHGNFTFDSYPIAEADLRPGMIRNLSVDNPLVVPVGATIRVQTTGQDVIHSFFVPALGVQKYTIPGRTMETWFRADRPGTFYGQCNQICGTNHWFMPIAVQAVPRAEFDAWVAQARTRAEQGQAPGWVGNGALLSAPNQPSAPAPASASAVAPGGNTNTTVAEARR